MGVSTDQIRLLYTYSTPHAAYLPLADDPSIDIFPPSPDTTTYPTPDPLLALLVPPNSNPSPSPSPYPFVPPICRIPRANHETWTNTRYKYEVLYYYILDPSLSYQYNILAYHAAINTDLQIGLINRTYPFSHASSHKNDPDGPSCNEAMHVMESEYYIAYLKK